ncbi:MAG: dihydrofolate reductase [Ignavibacteriaceae bacterium]
MIIAAVGKNGVIGRTTGEMPWHSKEEFQHFRNTTLGFPIIMGRKTFESLGNPLKGRLNIVLTRNKALKIPFDDVKIFDTLNKAYTYCKNLNYQKVFVIGGSYIFNEAVNNVDEMLLSVMNIEAVGDVYFPDFNEEDWEIVSREKRSEFEIFHYVRKMPLP